MRAARSRVVFLKNDSIPPRGLSNVALSGVLFVVAVVRAIDELGADDLELPARSAYMVAPWQPQTEKGALILRLAITTVSARR